MPQASLEGIDLKLSRADEHLSVLDAKRRAFMGDRPSVLREFDADTSECVFRVAGEPPPLEWGVPVSEMAHLLRSALDNLIWQVALARNREPHKASEFPIFKDKAAFNARKVQARMNGVTDDDRAFIEKTQPFHAGEPWSERHPLWLLYCLNNIDKHRFFQIGFIGNMLVLRNRLTREMTPIPLTEGANRFVIAAAQDSAMEVHGLSFPFAVRDVGEPSGAMIWSGGRSDDRTEVVRIRVVATGPDPQVEMQPRPTLDICLSDKQVPMTYSDLVLIRDCVNEVVDHFRPAF